MLKLLKWDFLNFSQKYYWPYLSFAAVFIITAVVPDNIRYFSSLVDGIAAVFSMLFWGYTFVISTVGLIKWLREDSSQLELSLTERPWKILLSKLILSFGVNISGLLLTELLWLIIDRFGISGITLFGSASNLLEYIVCILMFLVFVMFSYIVSKSFHITRNKAGFTTMLLTLLAPLLVICLAVLAFSATGIWGISFANHGELYITTNEQLAYLETALSIMGCGAVIFAGFWESCKLFERRFEID